MKFLGHYRLSTLYCAVNTRVMFVWSCSGRSQAMLHTWEPVGCALDWLDEEYEEGGGGGGGGGICDHI